MKGQEGQRDHENTEEKQNPGEPSPGKVLRLHKASLNHRDYTGSFEKFLSAAVQDQMVECSVFLIKAMGAGPW